MTTFNEFRRLFSKHPEFVCDLIHLHYLKTNILDYYDYAVMNVFHSLGKKTEWIDINLIMLPNAKSHEKINEKYVFENETDELGLPSTAPFYKVFSLLLKHTQ